MRRIREGGWSILAAGLLFACGGPAQPSVDEAQPAVPPPEPEPVAEEEVAEVEEEVAEVEEPEPAEPEEEPPPPPPEPVTATTSEEIKQAMFTASTDVVAFRRLVDPEWGIGAHNADEDIVRHYCDMDDLASHPGLGFVMSSEDPWRCSRDLSRCTSQSDGHGYAFHFRDGPGDVIYLSSVVHYEPRVPNRDNAAVRRWVGAGDGVCDLWRAMTTPADQPPQKLSVFVSGHTGLVPETVAEHHCGDEAASAYAERVAPLAQGGEPDRCDRNPTRCLFEEREVARTVYADDEGDVMAIAVTRPGMFQNLARQQERELDAFLRAAGRHDCDDEE